MAKRSRKSKAADVKASPKPASAPALSGSPGDGLWALAIVAATLLVYAPALHGDFLWDDDSYIARNLCLRTWAGLGRIWFEPGATEQYYPLTFTVFWLEYHLWGLQTLGYHLVTVILHALVSVLLWQVLARLRMPGALLAGAIFALHPINVMSVAWMTELKNTLSACLALGAGWAYLRFARLGVYEESGPTSKDRAWPGYAASLVLFQLAMLAKTAVSFLPATLLLVVWWQKKRTTARDVLGLLPMAGISIGMGFLTIYVEQHSGGASGAAFRLGFLQRLLVSGHSFWFYLGKLIFPYPLTFIYPRWRIDAASPGQYLYPLATALFLAVLWIARRRLGKGAWVAFMHFYMTTSMLVLLVVLYMMRFSFVSDHWQYFGSMSLVALFAAGMTRLLDRLGPKGRPAAAALKLGLLAVLGALSWQRAWAYDNVQTLWTDTLAKNPECWLARNNLGFVLLQEGRMREATAQFQGALKLKPDYADAHNNLGLTLVREGQLNPGMIELQKALGIDPEDVEAWNNLGLALTQEGQLDQAMAEYRKALEIEPLFAEARYNFGNALLRQGKLDDAGEQYQKALEIDPDYAQARDNLGTVLLNQGRIDEAISHYRAALQINPRFAQGHNNLGFALAQEGDADGAIAQYRQALEIDPAYDEARNNLAITLARTGRMDEALVEFRKLTESNPRSAQAHNNLGLALLDENQANGAVAEFQEALSLDPGYPGAQKNLARAQAMAGAGAGGK